MSDRACKVCRCVEENCCLGGCMWAPADPEICSSCYRTAVEIALWAMRAGPTGDRSDDDQAAMVQRLLETASQYSAEAFEGKRDLGPRTPRYVTSF